MATKNQSEPSVISKRNSKLLVGVIIYYIGHFSLCLLVCIFFCRYLWVSHVLKWSFWIVVIWLGKKISAFRACPSDDQKICWEDPWRIIPLTKWLVLGPILARKLSWVPRLFRAIPWTGYMIMFGSLSWISRLHLATPWHVNLSYLCESRYFSPSHRGSLNQPPIVTSPMALWSFKSWWGTPHRHDVTSPWATQGPRHSLVISAPEEAPTSENLSGLPDELMRPDGREKPEILVPNMLENLCYDIKDNFLKDEMFGTWLNGGSGRILISLLIFWEGRTG